jgi:tetratricopeptide (TPR) repeat protein
MLGFAWLALRQAQEALKNGRLEEAHRILCQSAAQGHKKSFELIQQVARAFVERGERQLRRDDAEAAWHDLLQAEQLDRDNRDADRLRQALVRLGLAEVRALFQAGEPGRASDAIGRLRERSVRQPELALLDEAAKGWLQARDQAARGELARALELVERVRRLLPDPVVSLDQFRAEMERQRDRLAELLKQLHEATEACRWRDVLDLADQVLAIAPQHPEARRLRGLAWKSVEPATIAMPGPASGVASAPRESSEGPRPEPAQRFLLWIDGVGGYLVCLANRVTVGQATSDGYVDVPLFADISRLHAALTRENGSYVLEAMRPVQVNGQPAEKALLRPNDRITLGTTCQLVFRQPAPVSASARLDLTSGQRLPLSVDGIILMADTLLLGPGQQMHVTMPDLKHPMVLYRHKDGLGVRCPGPLLIDGLRCQERGLLRPTSSVSGEDFSLALEPLGMRSVARGM